MDRSGLNGSIEKNRRQNEMEDGCSYMGAPTASSRATVIMMMMMMIHDFVVAVTLNLLLKGVPNSSLEGTLSGIIQSYEIQNKSKGTVKDQESI